MSFPIEKMSYTSSSYFGNIFCNGGVQIRLRRLLHENLLSFLQYKYQVTLFPKIYAAELKSSGVLLIYEIIWFTHFVDKQCLIDTTSVSY